MGIPIISDIVGMVKKASLLLRLKKVWDQMMKHIYDPNRKVRVVMPDNVTVEVKPAVASKINIAAVLLAAGSVAALFGIEIPEELPKHLEAWITLGISIFTIIARTWFTTKVTPSSATKV